MCSLIVAYICINLVVQDSTFPKYKNKLMRRNQRRKKTIPTVPFSNARDSCRLLKRGRSPSSSKNYRIQLTREKGGKKRVKRIQLT